MECARARRASTPVNTRYYVYSLPARRLRGGGGGGGEGGWRRCVGGLGAVLHVRKVEGAGGGGGRQLAAVQAQLERHIPNPVGRGGRDGAQHEAENSPCAMLAGTKLLLLSAPTKPRRAPRS